MPSRAPTWRVYLVTEVVYVLLNPSAQAALTAWASTNVANLEHESAGPLVLSAFVGRDISSSGRC